MCEGSDSKSTRELIQGLLLEVGRIMEDKSPDLAMAVPSEPAMIDALVGRLHQIVTDTLALVTAAQVLARGIGDEADQA